MISVISCFYLIVYCLMGRYQDFNFDTISIRYWPNIAISISILSISSRYIDYIVTSIYRCSDISQLGRSLKLTTNIYAFWRLPNWMELKGRPIITSPWAIVSVYCRTSHACGLTVLDGRIIYRPTDRTHTTVGLWGIKRKCGLIIVCIVNICFCKERSRRSQWCSHNAR